MIKMLKMNALFTMFLMTISSMSTAKAQSLDYEADIEPIFTNNCTSRGCHVSANAVGGLNL